MGRDTDAASATSAMSHAALLPLRRRSVWFEELASFRPALRRLPVDRSRLIVLPGTAVGERVLVPIARGRVLDRSSIDLSRDGWADRVEDICYRVRVAELRAEAAFPVDALTLTLIVNRWLAKRWAERRRAGRESEAGEGEDGATDHVFDLDATDASSIVDRLRRTVA